MSKTTREENIRRIIVLEDRIYQCRRCKPLLRCIKKPSLGKGDLEPAIMLVFEFNSTFSADIKNLIELRNLIKKEFGISGIYHSFMVRCQPKACTVRDTVSCYAENKLLDKENNNCILTGKACTGIPVRPSCEEIIACLPFLLEEIDILSPRYIIFFGERVSEFLLKSYGIFDYDIEPGSHFKYGNMILLTTVCEEKFGSEECRQLSQVLGKNL